TRLKYAFPKDYCLPVTDQPGANYNADSQGFTGAQSDAFSGGGMVETGGTYYDPSQFVPVTSDAYNYYHGGQFQEVAPCPYQPDQSHNHSQYFVGDAAVMPSHGEGFTFEQQAGALYGHAEDSSLMCSDSKQQAGALFGYSGNGSVRDGGEEDVLFSDFNCEMSKDEIHDILFGDNNDNFNCEQRDAGDAATDPE
uniref:Uncharacterized protein n=1 Tax=Aegilops tauschii subsp. strangulata TaxID=200361 RepID=A0A453QQH8_AEGTS